MENQEKIMGELYTIKAGLSVISKEADKVKSLEQSIQEAEANIKNREMTLEIGDSSLPYNQEQRKNAIKGIVSFSIGMLVKLIVFFGGFIGGALCAKAGFGELSSLAAGNDFNMVKTIACLCLAGLLPIIGMGAVLLRKIPPYFRDLKHHIKEFKSSNEYIKNCENKENGLRAANEDDKNRIAYCKRELEEQLKYSIPVVTATYDFMLSNCQSYIRDCDFENVDLIIYFIYSGRAVDIRDALLQTDALIRHNEMVELIRRESESIRNTIDNGFLNMSFAINDGFRNLSAQLKKQHDAEIQRLESIGADIRGVSRGLGEISNLQAIQNAYSAKIERNSRELAKDTREILKYARK